MGNRSQILGSRIAAAQCPVWRRHWKDSKRFYKPELDAAHDPAPQAVRPSLIDGILIPLPVQR
jgi:hypothetical protein